MKERIKNMKEMIFNNKSVIENYFFMTVLQVLNSFFYLLIHPYLIRTLGTEQYGRYVYISSIVTYFVTFITFGFDLIALKKVTENRENIEKKSEIVSTVFTAKIYLQLLSFFIYGGMIILIPSIRESYILYLCLFFDTFTKILLPSWYFQAIQKMRLVTYIQLFCKILTLPLIFLLINEPNDLIVFAIISVLSNVFGGIIAIGMLLINEKIRIKFITFSKVKLYYKEAFPLFLTNFISILKEQGMILIIGNFFGMKEVAIYDLANKIISVPRVLFNSINSAIFPKISQNLTREKVKRIIKYEYGISIGMTILVIIIGYWIILFLGGEKMIEAYNILIVISPTIITWLVAGAYIYFVFLPNSLNYFITKNQLVAMISFFLFAFLGIWFYDKIIVLCVAMTLSGIAEIGYCMYLTKKNKLL